MDRSLAEGALFTDQYQLTMAQLYWQQGLHERPARFEHFFRRYPDYGRHQAGYCIAAGHAWFGEWARTVRFGEPELAALRSHRTPEGHRVFDDGFLDWLAEVGGFDALDITAVPEGRVVHANVPMTVVEGPLALAQIIETPLLNQLNFQTLIATKASRVRQAARGGSVLEFGMRRAADQGANAASRASLVGGADFSSAVGVSHLVGFPPRGTHAHALVQVYMALGEGELGAFRAYAHAYPDETLLLVDTIDTLGVGVPNAITVFDEVRASGHEPVGIRLDSGDLAHLAVLSSQQLDEAGYPDARIVLSSGLDELAIWQIRNQVRDEAPTYGMDAESVIDRLVYGVGTKMATSDGDPNLDGVYKLVAVQDESASWQPAIKVSDTPAKVVNPGRKRVVRVYGQRGKAVADVLAHADEDLAAPLHVNHHATPGISRTITRISEVEDLLEPMARDGIDQHEAILAARERRDADLARLDPGVLRLVNPHVYHVSLSDRIATMKADLVAEARASNGS
ncbi:nicotinate phosphoribosyltransferase [Salsipaludibacter albus]|uniref:nicotinate phosphoribosyltransferase n=1 Tax=Salsipaludibacter albus TaxID=2849650 RepID=UPI001EE4B4AA|nr:nicotinate phosphoribosyltransferase [Salsipaludibacter albus]MBY5164519.1 nicotinate phosphoribosyltransferase [Salsipaludibacter albus]